MYWRRLKFYVLVVGLLLASVASAQEGDPTRDPEFLYEHDDGLYLVNAVTGETREMMLNLDTTLYFAEWSPSGETLLVRMSVEDSPMYCVNEFHVDDNEWVYDEPLICNVNDAIFTPDETQIVYKAPTEALGNSTLNVFDVETQTSRRIAQTTSGDLIHSSGFSNLRWSPGGTYLIYTQYESIMGGSLNTLVVMDFTSGNRISVRPPRSSYYASYSPIWSPDEAWFLIVLKDEYVISGTNPVTNHRGDVYLVNSATGQSQRLTYTPASEEHEIGWTEDGQITYTYYNRIDVTMTTDDAADVEPVPFDEIIQPESFMPDSYGAPERAIYTPTGELAAWVDYNTETSAYELMIARTGYQRWYRNPYITAFVDNAFTSLIGWRPIPEQAADSE